MRTTSRLVAVLIIWLASTQAAFAQYAGWAHAGSLFILTTPDGANLPAGVVVKDFPVLVRLHRDFFNFDQAAPDGADIRFSTPAGQPLAYQIDEWDAPRGQAAIWVRIPTIEGNTRQEIKIHWGKANARSESNGPAVFNASNGFLSVWHMGASVQDDVGTLKTISDTTAPKPGIVGAGRHFVEGQGIFCGDKIPNYPTTGDHTTQAWFRAERPNTTLIGWGNEGGGQGTKIRMMLRSPPHIHIDSFFSDTDGQVYVPMNEWVHVAYAYTHGQGKLYINGRLDAVGKPDLKIKSPGRLWIGGWYNNYDFVGDLDEVRVSSVARSADWVHLEYENQKPMQSLVGPVVQPAAELSVAPASVAIDEAKSVTIHAELGAAQKIYWILTRNGHETVTSVDQKSYTFEAGRVSADDTAMLRLRAVFPNGSQTRDVPITIRKTIPEPSFTLSAPASWDGRKTLEITPTITNFPQMQAAGAGKLSYRWKVSGMATIHRIEDNKLILQRSQSSGTLTVAASVSNGGAEIRNAIEIAVSEPAADPWVHHESASDEMPEDYQFIARDETGKGTIVCKGRFAEPTSIFLRVYADDKIQSEAIQNAWGKFRLTAKIEAGLIEYRTVFGMLTTGGEKILSRANHIVCGDAYIIQGQSNAVATDFGKGDGPPVNDWVRSFGSTSTSPQLARLKLWGKAESRAQESKLAIGYWGMELGRRLVESQKVPICFINGAVGGTRIDQHQRNPENPEDVSTIYGRLLWRVRAAHLEDGIRGVFWHQGENDQGADGPTGTFGFLTYRDLFIDMAGAWKQDYPNIQRYFIFQIWPRACAMGNGESDNLLREVQRRLPSQFSHMSIMSTLGVRPAGGCHYPPEGYAEIARLICPVVERDLYGKSTGPVTAPNLRRAYFMSEDAIILEFDQAIRWDPKLVNEFYLDGVAGGIKRGIVSGNLLKLTLSSPGKASTISYLDSKSWSQDRLLMGENGIAALTFCSVWIDAPPGAQK